MKIFKSIKFVGNKPDEDLLVLYEQKIEERKNELSNLDNLLKSKRKEIAKLNDEKTELIKELERLENDKLKIESEVEKTRGDLELLHTMEIQEREVAVSINSQISRLSNEVNEKYLLQDDIEKMKSENDELKNEIGKSEIKLKNLREEEDYLKQVKQEINLSIEKFNKLEEEISLANERLKALRENEKKLESKSFKKFYSNLGLNKINNTQSLSLTKNTKITQRCAAITKKGERCCKKTIPNSKFCTIHTKR
ncbi:MAG TPA: hypothetical protein DHV28_11080 [Ignavibacteriales bacterium]|nr:hypothetical protein [Ignavibacteriales bacterium]